MTQTIKLIVYPVKNIEAAKKLFAKFLGIEPYMDSAYYVGFKLGNLEIGLDPNSKLGPIAYTDVQDIKSNLKDLVELGAEVVQTPKDVGGGLLVASLKDVDGNILGLRQSP